MGLTGRAHRRCGTTCSANSRRRLPHTSRPAVEGLGFTCRAAETAWTCLHVARGEGRAVWEAEVTVGLAEAALAGLEVRFREATR